MEKMRDFLRDHGMVCAVVLCACAAVVTGAWAVRTIQSELNRQVPPVTEQQKQQAESAPLSPQAQPEWEENEWNTGFDVAGRAEGIPEERSSSGEHSSSGVSSGASSAGKPGEKPSESTAPADVGSASYAPPVSGSVVQAFSGDELVYNETLEDWRTHNGTDYACSIGNPVKAPVSGKVAVVKDSGNWGGTLELIDAENRTWRLYGVVAEVKTGEDVTCGQPVGKVGGIACETAVGSHVHLEIEQDGKYLDPAQIIR